MLQVVVHTGGSLLNNWAFAFNVPLAIQMVFRSAGMQPLAYQVDQIQINRLSRFGYINAAGLYIPQEDIFSHSNCAFIYCLDF